MINLIGYAGLAKIISGGQTGADQAGLEVARKFGVATGGSIAKGYRTCFGSDPSLARYGLDEHKSFDYPPRTKQNAKDGDVTVRLASNFNSAGEKLTLRYCQFFKKPVLDIKLNGYHHQEKAEALFEFIIEHSVQILNVAGNADRDTPTNGFHFRDASQILTMAFDLLSDANLLVR